MSPTFFSLHPSPLGELLLTSDGEALTGILFEEEPQARRIDPAWVRDDARFGEAVRQLAEYFAGRRVDFDLPLSPRGTPFQQRVWTALRDIRFGETESYGALARRVGSPKASRAVGAANGRNPLPIVIPCHRVVGSTGSLTGYGGGLERKRWLLDHERPPRPGSPVEPSRG